MPERTQIVKVGTEDVEVVRVEVVNSHEPWAEYLLDDGTTLRVKYVLRAVHRATTRVDAEGLPSYIFSHAMVTETIPGAGGERHAPGDG